MLKWIKSHKLVSFLLFLLIAVSLILSASSLIVAWGINRFLKDHASDVSIGKLELSLWDSDLRIENLSAKDLHGKKLSLGGFYVDWELNALWDNQLIINQIDIHDVKVDIDLENFTPTQIGPLVLAKFKGEADSKKGSEHVDSDAAPWQVRVENISISESEVCIFDSVQDFHSLSIPLKDNQNIQLCGFVGRLKVDEPITLDLQQKLKFEGDISLSRFALFNQKREALFGLKSFEISGFSLNDSVTIKSVLLEQLSLLSDVDKDIADLGAGFERLAVGPIVIEPKTQSSSVQEIKLEGFGVLARASNKKLETALAIEQLNIGQFSQSAQKTEASKIGIQSFSALKDFDNKIESGEYLVRLKDIQLEKFSVTSDAIELGLINLNGLATYLAVDEKGINLSKWMLANEAEKEDISTKEQSNQSSPKIEISGLTIGEDSLVHFSEGNSGQMITHKLTDIKFNLGKILIPDQPQKESNDSIESQNTEENRNAEAAVSKAESVVEATPLSYSLNIGESGKLTGEGTILLSSSIPELDIKGQVSSMDLVEYTHYASRFIGYRIERGQLNLDYQFKLKSHEIDANFKTQLDKFELGSLESHEENELNQELGVPLPMALNLLRDSDDNIELDFPVTGNVDSPDFSIASIISTVSVKAIKNAVIYHYSPLGMFSLASGVFDLATALNFDPIEFEIQKNELNEETKKQLDKVVSLMSEKPRIKMVVCGEGTWLDYPDLTLEEIKQKKKEDFAKLDTTALLTLAKQRQSNVIKYIVEQGGIEKSRLLGCNVKMSKKKGTKPQVKLSI